MEAEKLKVIAEGMGYEAWESSGNIMGRKDGNTQIYHPHLTNFKQMVEIMEKCFINIEHSEGVVIAETMQQKRGIALGWAEAETINEAVCNAAYEYFNQP